MLQNLAKCGCTRRAAASLNFVSSGLTPNVQKRFYVTGKNQHLLNLLKECEVQEEASPTRNRYKIRSFRMAAAVIEKLDFRVERGDDLKGVKHIGVGIRDRVDALLNHNTGSPKKSEISRAMAIQTLMTVPALGRVTAEALYDAGCDTIKQLHLKKYNGVLRPKAKRGLKYMKHLQHPLPRENAETIVNFCKHFLPMDTCEIIIAGEYRRDAPNLSEPIELLIIDKNAADPIPNPPHPSTLKCPGLIKPTRTMRPFIQHYTAAASKNKSPLMNKIIGPLETMGVVSDTTALGVNLWQGWFRVPKKGESWELRRERIEGIQEMKGDFHRVNITYASEKSRGAALLALTGDRDFYFDCTRKATQASLYLNEWGLWEWKPDPESLSRFQTSDGPHEKTSLGAIWGSETEEDKGHWTQLDAFGEEQIFEHIGAEYVLPEKRNLRYILGSPHRKRYSVQP